MDLARVAAETPDLTGADLGALLADAQLAAVQAALAEPGGAEVDFVWGFFTLGVFGLAPAGGRSFSSPG